MNFQITSFPSWVYHRTRPAQLVLTAEALAALGEGWADTPAAFYTDAPAQVSVQVEPSSLPARRRGRSSDKES